jgi:hypothetical protein
VVSGIQRSVAHAISSLQARPLSQVGAGCLCIWGQGVSACFSAGVLYLIYRWAPKI